MVTVGLTADQFSKGNHRVLLSGDQHKAVSKALRNKKGLRLTMTYDQILKNKERGLLNEVLEFIEATVPYAKKITPLIRKKAAPALKEHVIPWLKEWINNELDKVIGSGLDAKTIQYVRDHMTKAAGKNLKINPLTLGDLKHYAKVLGFKHFRGVFMRDSLPDKVNKLECGIINLGGLYASGTHWTSNKVNIKNEKDKIYFDYYGNARPPLELVRYLGKYNLKYNADKIQTFTDPPICGHLCLEVVRRFSNGEEWNNISLKIKGDKYIWKSWFDV